MYPPNTPVHPNLRLSAAGWAFLTIINHPIRGSQGRAYYDYLQFAIRIYARLHPAGSSIHFRQWFSDLTADGSHLIAEDHTPLASDAAQGRNRPRWQKRVEQLLGARMNVDSQSGNVRYPCLTGGATSFTVHPDYIEEILQQTADYVEEVPADEEEPPVYQQQGGVGGFANSHSVVAPIGVDQESEEWFAQIAEDSPPTPEIEQLEQEDDDQRGVVYIMHNPAWDGWVVTGKAKQLSRMRSYQTACPFRDFQTIGYARVENRGESEAQLQNLLNSHATQRGAASTNGRLSEWFEISPEQAYDLLVEQHGAAAVSQGNYFEA